MSYFAAVKLSDGTTPTIFATVKPASTAAIATDPALVVAISPNNTVPVSITTLGQQLAAASIPVVLTAAQLTTLTPPTSVAVTNVGTFLVQATLAAETTKVLGTIRITGNVGGIFDAVIGTAVPANAIQVGLRAATAYPTAVTDGQLVGAMADKAGRQVAVLNSPRDLIGTAVLSNNSSAVATVFIAAGAAGIFNDLITLAITNRSATATVISLSDNGAAGNVYTFAIAANGGIVLNFPTPVPQGTAAAAWDVLNSAAVAVDYFAVYAKNK